jgi:hypothetical protein
MKGQGIEKRSISSPATCFNESLNRRFRRNAYYIAVREFPDRNFLVGADAARESEVLLNGARG